MRNNRTIINTLVLVLSLLPCLAQAAILGMEEQKLDFTKADVVEKIAKWSHSDKVKPGPNGLGWTGEHNSSYDLWIETSELLALGTSWRPTLSATLTVTIPWTGPKAEEIRGTVYARYSPDGVHWSTWQALQGDEDNGSKVEKRYQGTLSVPSRERTRYTELLQEYGELDVPWTSDEEAAVEWILGKHPDFFSNELPFIGYVQILYKTHIPGSHHIEKIDIRASYGMGGLHQAPKDNAMYQGRDGPWRFRAK